MHQTRWRYAILLGYLLCVPAANWTLQHIGQAHPFGPRTIPVWWGVDAPSGVLWIGVALTLRDVLRDQFGRAWMVGAIHAGALLSALVSRDLALASAVAFGLGEGADALVYEPLRQRGRTVAMLLSNAVGLVIDSLVFLWLAFHSLAFWQGQMIGKALMSLVAVGLIQGWRHRDLLIGLHHANDARQPTA